MLLILLLGHSIRFENKGRPPMSNTPMDSFTGAFLRDCVLDHSTNTEDTILAGRPATSPKAPKMSQVKRVCPLHVVENVPMSWELSFEYVLQPRNLFTTSHGRNSTLII